MTELTTIPEYNQTEQALTVLRENYAGVVFEVDTPKGMAAAKEARAELRTLRVDLEAKRKAIKEPALRLCQRIDSEAKRITAELAKLEDPIDQTIKLEEGRKDAERAERARQAEAAARVLREKLDAIRNRPFQVIGKPADAIKAMVDDTQALSVAEFPETMQAQQVLDETVARLITMHTERVAQDVEGARLAAERAELDRARQEQEAAHAEQERIGREAREAAERDAKAARAKQDAELRAQREAQEQQLAAERKRLADEESERQRVSALERERLDNERRELDRQKEVAAQAERDRVTAQWKKVEEERIETEHKALEQSIAQADLMASAREAVELLQDSGFAKHIVTLKLAAALARETKPKTRRKAA